MRSRSDKVLLIIKRYFSAVSSFSAKKVGLSTPLTGQLKMGGLLSKALSGWSGYTDSVTDLKTDPVVTVTQGQLKGEVGALFNGSKYFSFKGIPYAEPPIGELRFKDPLPPKPWKGILEATKHGPVCPQMDLFTGNMTPGDENCLFLNVYTRSPTGKRPVMVYIHGGAFMCGSGDSELYGPEYLLQHDVVLVTFNYRLEALGFLCLDTPEVPGNAGMKDQVMALRWVKENIVRFGGDAQNITLFGESAGSTSVTYHMVSPLSKGLFHKAIAQSGVFLNDWCQGKEGKARAFRAGQVLGKETNDTTDLLKFLRSLPALDLAKLTFKTMTYDEKHRGLPIHFAPVVEKEFAGVEGFLTEEPMQSLMQNKIAQIPMLVGYNSGEGLLSLRNVERKIDFYNKNFSFKVPREICETVPENVLQEFGRRVKGFYCEGRDATLDDIQKLCDLESDLHFVYGVHRFLHLYTNSNKTPVYMYKFCYSSDMNFTKIATGASHLNGACHADDLFYLFSSLMTNDVYAEQEKVREMVYVLTKMWTDFAKTGNPTPDRSLGFQWTPYTPSSKEYLNMDTVISVEKYADKDRVEFWNKLYCESGLPCITKSSL